MKKYCRKNMENLQKILLSQQKSEKYREKKNTFFVTATKRYFSETLQG